MPESKRIGDILVERGVIDAATAELIEAERLLTRSRFVSAAVAHGRISEIDALAALSIRDGIPAVDLSRAILATRVAKRTPLTIARQHLILPVREDGPYLVVAMATPKDQKVIDELTFATGMQVLPHAALYSRLVELIPLVHATKGAFFRGPLAPAELSDQELIPIVTGEQLSAGLDVEVVIDSDIDASSAAAEDDNHARAAAGGAAAAAAAPARPAVPVDGAIGEQKVVLVVEDEPDIARLIVSTVSQLGCEVITASRGLEALQLIKDRHPALIILDAMLPEVHGFEICRKVKQSKRFGNTPVLMVSAVYRGWEIAADVKATYKADAFLEKPFRVADLRRLAGQLLEQPSGHPPDERLGDEAQALVQRGQESLLQDDLDQAIAQLRQAESLEPFSASIQFLLAAALEKHGGVLQAIYHYERAIELKPDYFSAAQKAANLYQAQGFRQKAADMWQRALRAAPDAQAREQIKKRLVSLL
jgi:DNA-binding response OmpR family regulator